jgi:hypothetical protein
LLARTGKAHRDEQSSEFDGGLLARTAKTPRSEQASELGGGLRARTGKTPRNEQSSEPAADCALKHAHRCLSLSADRALLRVQAADHPEDWIDQQSRKPEAGSRPPQR